MRVIAGTLGGRRLVAPGRGGLRATQDRVRETLFNIIAEDVAGSRVADLFAGTGSLGIEALSRGAAQAVFVEKSRTALDILERNLRLLELRERGRVYRGTVASFLAGSHDEPYDLVLADPPYETPDADATIAAVAGGGVLRAGGLLVVERRRSEPIAGAPAGMTLLTGRAAGDTRLDFYRRGDS